MTGSADLIEHYRQIHATSEYGNTSTKNLRFLRPEVKLLNPQSVIDYGCGQSTLLERLNLPTSCKLAKYDPAIPQHAKKPDEVFDLLINVDVLEHIEETDLDAVLSEMRSMCRNAIIIIDTAPAQRTLPDGRNAHVNLKSHAWWQEKLGQYFDHVEPITTARRTRAGFRTWPRKPGQTLPFIAMRLMESAAYTAKRIVRRHK